MTPEVEQAIANIILVLVGAIFMWCIVHDDHIEPPSRGRTT